MKPSCIAPEAYKASREQCLSLSKKFFSLDPFRLAEDYHPISHPSSGPHTPFSNADPPDIFAILSQRDMDIINGLTPLDKIPSQRTRTATQHAKLEDSLAQQQDVATRQRTAALYSQFSVQWSKLPMTANVPVVTDEQVNAALLEHLLATGLTCQTCKRHPVDATHLACCSESQVTTTKRHDDVVKTIGDHLRSNGFTVLYEPHTRRPGSNLRADLCFHSPNHSSKTIDVCITNTKSTTLKECLDKAHKRKANKHKMETYEGPFTPITIHRCGTLHEASQKLLKTLPNSNELLHHLSMILLKHRGQTVLKSRRGF